MALASKDKQILDAILNAVTPEQIKQINQILKSPGGLKTNVSKIVSFLDPGTRNKVLENFSKIGISQEDISSLKIEDATAARVHLAEGESGSGAAAEAEGKEPPEFIPKEPTAEDPTGPTDPSEPTGPTGPTSDPGVDVTGPGGEKIEFPPQLRAEIDRITKQLGELGIKENEIFSSRITKELGLFKERGEQEQDAFGGLREEQRGLFAERGKAERGRVGELLGVQKGEVSDLQKTVSGRLEERRGKLSELFAQRAETEFAEFAPELFEDLQSRGLLRSSELGVGLGRFRGQQLEKFGQSLREQELSDVDLINQISTGALSQRQGLQQFGLESQLGLGRAGLEADIGLGRTGLESQLSLNRASLESQLSLGRAGLEAEVGLGRTAFESEAGLRSSGIQRQFSELDRLRSGKLAKELASLG